MRKYFNLAALLVALLLGGVAGAQFPVLDALADKVIQKYQSSTCEQLWQKKGEPKPPMEQKAIQSCATSRKCASLSSTKWQRLSPTKCSNAG